LKGIKNYVIGIDGCRFGWVAVKVDALQNFSISKHKTIDEIFQNFPKADIYLIDMPIGLADKSHPRNVEELARPHLKPNKTSSIFPVPCRPAIYSNSYEEAKKNNLEILGKSIPIQSWNISHKIKKLDLFLIQNKTFIQKVSEAHPELCFAKLNNGQPLFSKKNTVEGIEERLNLISKFSSKASVFYKNHQNDFLKKEVKADDFVDALGLALVAFLGIKNGFEILIKKRETDANGIPFNMVFFNADES